MQQQTKETILTSLIVTLLTAVPISLLSAYLVVSLSTQPESEHLSQQEIQDAISKNQPAQDVVEPPEQAGEVREEVMQTEILQPNQQVADSEVGRLKVGREIFTTDKATYSLTPEWITSGIVQPIYRTPHGKSEQMLWISDLRELTAEPLNAYDGFWIFSNPGQGEYVYLRKVTFDSESPNGKIFAFNINTKELRVLSAASRFSQSFNRSLSPNGLGYAVYEESSIGNDKELYVVDLLNNQAQLVVQLAENETLNAGANALSESSDIQWLDNDTIRYAVYDQSKKSSPFTDKEALFIDYRTVDINQP
jgi:hypothetical protein